MPHTRQLIDTSHDSNAYGLETLISNAEDLGYIVLDHTLHVKNVSHNFASIIGASKSSNLLGAKIDDVFSALELRDSTKNLSSKSLTELISGGFGEAAKPRQTYLVTTQNGRRVTIRSWLSSAEHMLVTVRDVSEESRHKDVLEMAMEAANAGCLLYTSPSPRDRG